jgi:hypothetical protein
MPCWFILRHVWTDFSDWCVRCWELFCNFCIRLLALSHRNLFFGSNFIILYDLFRWLLFTSVSECLFLMRGWDLCRCLRLQQLHQLCLRYNI